jgi:hypothetical protein
VDLALAMRSIKEGFPMGRTQHALAVVGVLVLASWLWAGQALAVDGVIEINQARALAGGVTPADTPGFPVTINASGSYRLTGNLTVPDENTTAIQVDTGATSVTIDLNGFAILGPVFCTNPPTVTCSPSGGLGKGIEAPGGFTTETLHVRDGMVRGMGLNGILASRFAIIERVQVSYSGGIGLYLGPGAVVTDSVSEHNKSTGIALGEGSVARGALALANGSYGIFANSGTVVQSVMRSNVSYGLVASSEVGYGQNDISLNNGGNGNPQVSGGLQVASNVCGGDLTCP